MSTTLASSVGIEEKVRSSSPVSMGRLMSLDLFRGVTIAGMILVNDPGDERSAYWPLRHAEWNGWTPTDLVFPFFLFIVGVAISFSLRSHLQRGESRKKMMGHALRRGLALFALGILLHSFPDRFHLDDIRIYGVLQRIALCYVISMALVLWTGWRTQVITIIGCLAGYWILMRFVPVPGFGVPTHGFPFLDPDRNLGAWLDRKLLFGHLDDVTRDPEGLLGTIPSVATALLGVLTGQWLRSERARSATARGLLAFGVVGVVAGEVLNLWFPINKRIWSSSYVIFTAGLALVCLALCYWVLDVKQWRGLWSKFFLIFGLNSIAAYSISEALARFLEGMQVHLPNGQALSWKEIIYQHGFASFASPANASLFYALVYVLVCWAALWVLYRKGIFLKI